MHAEGFAAGELKHGPIALIDEGTPVVCVVPSPGRPGSAARQDRLQHPGGTGPRRPHHRDRRGGRRGGTAVRRPPHRGAADARRCSRRWSPRCRCRCSRVRSRPPAATTSTSRATWPSRSPSSRPARCSRSRCSRRSSTVTPGLDTMLVLRTTAAGRAGGRIRRGGRHRPRLPGLGGGERARGDRGAGRVAARVRGAADRRGGLPVLAGRPGAVVRPPAPAAGQEGVPHSQNPVGGRPSCQPEPAGEHGDVAGASAPGSPPTCSTRRSGVFYLSVMPQFLPEGVDPLAGSLRPGGDPRGRGVRVADAGRAGRQPGSGWLTRPNVRRRLEQLTGVVFLGFGLRLALERAP